MFLFPTLPEGEKMLSRRLSHRRHFFAVIQSVEDIGGTAVPCCFLCISRLGDFAAVTKAVNVGACSVGWSAGRVFSTRAEDGATCLGLADCMIKER